MATTTLRRLAIIASLGGFLGVSQAFGQAKGEWPCYHGPRHDNKSTETGLLKTWPEGGPRLLWTAEGLGKGYSSVSIARGMIFAAGMINRQTVVIALDLDGKIKWRQANGRSWQATMAHAVAYDGARGTPTFDDGKVYHLSEGGRLGAFQADDGKELWAIELFRQFEAPTSEYGLSESVLIDGERLVCCPDGAKGYMVCLNKNTGKLVWANTQIEGTVGYSSLIPAELAGVRQYVGTSDSVVFGVQAETGKLLWSVEHRNMRGNNATDPVPYNDCVYAASGYGKGSLMVRLKAEAGGGVKAEMVWSSKLMDSLHGGVLRVDGYLYGSGHDAKKWSCLDFMTGKEMWTAPGKGSMTYADGMLYCLDERGTMSLIEAAPRGYRVAGSFQVPRGGAGLHWPHPVVCGGRLYVRHADKLFAYDVAAR